MIDQQLASFLDDALTPAARASIETQLKEDPESLRFVLEQQQMERALRSLLGKDTRHEKLRDSILMVVSGQPVQELQAQVLADTLGDSAFASSTAPASPVWFGPAKAWLNRVRHQLQFQRLAWSACACVLALLGLGAWLLFGPAADTIVDIGQFAAVTGQPALKRGANQPALNPKPQTRVRLGDRIETGDADKSELVFKDGTSLRLGFNTVIEIPKLKDTRREVASALVRPPEIKLIRGQVWTKVKKLPNTPRYAIQTEAATAVARGTEFGVKIQRPPSTNALPPTTVLTVKEGAVDFSNSFGSVRATAMTESTASVDGAPTQPVVLRIIKTFDLAPGKQLNVGAWSTVFHIDYSAYRMVYPQGWAGFDARPIQGSGKANSRRLQIVRVWPGSPAERAGLVVGDVITRVNGQSVTNIQDVLRPVFRQQGAAVILDVLRDELPRTASFVTTKHPYALPQAKRSADLSANLLKATWSLIEAECQWATSSNEWHHLTEQFKTVLDRYPADGALHNNLAVWYEMNEQPVPAIQHLSQAVAAEPNNALYRYNLSKVLASIGNFERWAEEAENAVKLAPGWIPGVIEVAHAYSVLSRFDEALAVLEAALQANPDQPKLWETKGFLLLTNRKPQEALNALNKAIELEPSNAQWWSLLDIIYETLGDLSKAEAASRKAIALDPGFAEAHQALAIDIISRFQSRLPEDVTDASAEELAIERWRERAAEELAVIAEAERFARRAIELKPDDAIMHKDLGQILLLRGAVDDAEKILRQGMQLDPQGRAAADACNALAYHLAVWGIRLDEALQLAQRAAQIYPAGYIFDTLAVVHFRRGEWDQAEAAWKNCIELAGPDGDASSSFHLGKVYERKNQTASAVAAYQEALRLRPDFPEASRALEKLLK